MSNEADRIHGPSGWLNNKTLDTVDNTMRTMSFGSPIVRAIGLGGLGYLGGRYVFAPLAKMLSPNWYNEQTEGDEYNHDEFANRMGWVGALGLGGVSALSSYSPSQEWGGFKAFPEKLTKEGSYYDYNDPANAIPLGYAKDFIAASNNLTPMMKASAFDLLNAFNAPPETPVTSADLIRGAINTGVSAVAGAAVGFVTAKALGLPNPKATATITGGVSALFTNL